MNVSGIVVLVQPQHVQRAQRALLQLQGVDVHQTEAATGKMVVTIEAETIDREVECLRAIQALPDVILAELVHHHFEDDAEIAKQADSNSDQAKVLPEFLKD